MAQLCIFQTLCCEGFLSTGWFLFEYLHRMQAGFYAGVIKTGLSVRYLAEASYCYIFN